MLIPGPAPYQFSTLSTELIKLTRKGPQEISSLIPSLCGAHNNDEDCQKNHDQSSDWHLVLDD